MEIIIVLSREISSREVDGCNWLCQQINETELVACRIFNMDDSWDFDQEKGDIDRYGNVLVIPKSIAHCATLFSKAPMILWWGDDNSVQNNIQNVRGMFGLHLVRAGSVDQDVLRMFPAEAVMNLEDGQNTADLVQYVAEQTAGKQPVNVVIFGSNNQAKILNEIVKAYNRLIRGQWGETLRVMGFMSLDSDDCKTLDGVAVLSSEQVKAMVSDQLVDALLVPRENYFGQGDYLQYFLELNIGLQNVYIANWINKQQWSKDEILDFFTPYYSCDYIPYLEFHLADHCNLNCAACEHYSGLVEEEVFADFDSFKKDFLKLKEYIKEIGVIRLLGGEPLLNKDINKFVLLSREVYPNSQIWVTTNGLLLKSMPEEFYEVMRNSDAKVWISSYPPLEGKIEELVDHVTSRGVQCMASEMTDEFRKCQVLTPNDDKTTRRRFNTCYQKGCRNLYEGHLAACFLPFTTKYFNAYFDKQLPDDGAIDLYAEGLTLEEINQRLTTPFERCRYCGVPENVKWKQVKLPSSLEDWVKDCSGKESEEKDQKKGTVYILCPAKRVTGGVELAHQMCYVINKFTDLKALMWYTDIDDTTTETILLDIPAPEAYEIYETEHVSDYAEIDKEENIVIFPEGLTTWMPLIDNAKKVLWWMSVDNYVIITNGGDLKYISENVDLHLYQSYYSKAFVEQNIPGAKGLFVSDYINDDYRSCDWNAEGKRDIAVYNPKKGFEDLKPIIEKADWLQWIPLQNMDRKQMKETMLQSKIYVDFGYHPGKDRIPREAAACGCCVITNKKGAAAFSGDVPVPDQYKFKDTADHVDEINDLLHDICDHFENHARNFDAYREMIKGEKDKFIVDVIRFVNQTSHQS